MLAEKPITSYFSRLPLKNKAAIPPKKQADPKRKRTAVEAESRVASTSKARDDVGPSLKKESEGVEMEPPRKRRKSKGKTVHSTIDLTLDDDEPGPSRAPSSPLRTTSPAVEDLEPPEQRLKGKEKAVEAIIDTSILDDERFPSPIQQQTTEPMGPPALPPKAKAKSVNFAANLATIVDDRPLPPTPTEEDAEETIPSSQSQYYAPLVQNERNSSFEEDIPSSQSQYFYPPCAPSREETPSGSAPPEWPYDDEVPSSQSQPVSVRHHADNDMNEIPSSQCQVDEEIQSVSIRTSDVRLDEIFEEPLPVLDDAKDMEESETESDDQTPIVAPPPAGLGEALEETPPELTDFLNMFGDETYPESFPQSLQL
ncbi:hypothetical protein HMN09_00512500 [Mycena chlorophos]|uniref:Uncharacterized protein n=1 Tax=Mycena chlorophos TaxID=658473 RepID=A0A8H6TA42_MYCCL|nr:hypothetical protein HMN09_00512500 [Mycena chlorophos]